MRRHRFPMTRMGTGPARRAAPVFSAPWAAGELPARPGVRSGKSGAEWRSREVCASLE